MYLTNHHPQNPVYAHPQAMPAQHTARSAYAATYKRYKQAWSDLDYAAMGNAALDMRDIHRELGIAHGELFTYS